MAPAREREKRKVRLEQDIPHQASVALIPKPSSIIYILHLHQPPAPDHPPSLFVFSALRRMAAHSPTNHPLPLRALLPTHLPLPQPSNPPRRPLADFIPPLSRRNRSPTFNERERAVVFR